MPNLAEKLESFNPSKLVQWTAWIVAGASVALVVVSAIYFLTFHGDFSSKQDIWGQFGDYIGGTLNPIFSFLSLVVLVLTLALQSRQVELARLELENSKQELEATRDELKKSSAAQEKTAESLTQQAEFAALSARISALNASLSVVSELIRQWQGVPMQGGQVTTYQDLVTRKERIANEILSITDNQLRK